MDSTVIIGALVTAILGMAGFFALILRDERTRNERLLSRLEEQNKLVLDAIAVLSKAVDSVEGKKQLFEAITALSAATTALMAQKDREAQFYAGLEKLAKATELLEDEQRRVLQREQRGGSTR